MLKAPTSPFPLRLILFLEDDVNGVDHAGYEDCLVLAKRPLLSRDSWTYIGMSEQHSAKRRRYIRLRQKHPVAAARWPARFCRGRYRNWSAGAESRNNVIPKSLGKGYLAVNGIVRMVGVLCALEQRRERRDVEGWFSVAL